MPAPPPVQGGPPTWHRIAFLVATATGLLLLAVDLPPAVELLALFAYGIVIQAAARLAFRRHLRRQTDSPCFVRTSDAGHRWLRGSLDCVAGEPCWHGWQEGPPQVLDLGPYDVMDQRIGGLLRTMLVLPSRVVVTDGTNRYDLRLGHRSAERLVRSLTS